MANVVVMGAAGRMGQMLVNLVVEHPDLTLVGAIERAEHPGLGTDVGAVMGAGEIGVPLTSDTLEALAQAQIVLDFTTPALSAETAGLAAQARAVHVIGTTGIDDAAQAKIDAAAHHAVIVQAGNMSLGVNLMTKLTETVARALDDIFDIEVVEAHHNRKVDAPSGTALMLGEAAATGRGVDLADARDSGRDGITGARRTGDIGFSAIRGGDVVGEHDVIFAGPGERIILRHIATDRRVFAHGALKAGVWGLDKAPGHYNMDDVLGLR